jgi:peptide/nickel transport system permease protein
MATRRYLLRKIAQVLVTMIFILMFNFFLFRVMPGNPVTLLARSTGARLTPAAQRELIHDLGLDQPLVGQFLTYIKDTLTGNFGKSTIVYPGDTVGGIFLEFARPTLILVGISTILSTIFGVLMGIYAGWRRGSRYDLGSMGLNLVLYAMPEWWLGLLLLIFLAGGLHLFPSGGAQSVTQNLTGLPHFVDLLNHLFLPCLTLALAFLGEYYLLMRSSLLDVLGEEYITLARAKGLREKMVLWRHAVRNALLPTVTLVALNFGFVIGGAITVEVVFSYPGLGKLTFEALQAKDFPLLQGMFLFFSLAVIVANFVADLLYVYLDPRVREA